MEEVHRNLPKVENFSWMLPSCLSVGDSGSSVLPAKIDRFGQQANWWRDYHRQWPLDRFIILWCWFSCMLTQTVGQLYVYICSWQLQCIQHWVIFQISSNGIHFGNFAEFLKFYTILRMLQLKYPNWCDCRSRLRCCIGRWPNTQEIVSVCIWGNCNWLMAKALAPNCAWLAPAPLAV